MTFYSASISADTTRCLHHGLIATRQPPRLRVVSAFARRVALIDPVDPVDPVDIAALTTIYPPLTKQPLTSATLGRDAPGGGKKVVPTAGQSTPALTPTTMNTRAHFVRVIRFAREPIAPWTPIATVLSRPQWRAPKGFSRCIPSFHLWQPRAQQRCSGENSLPTRDIKGQDSRGHPPTAILFFCSLCPCRYPFRTTRIHCH